MSLGVITCASHTETLARWHCAECEQVFCDACIELDQRGGTRYERCKGCREILRPIAAELQAAPFDADSLIDAFGYPVRGGGAAIVGVGALLVACCSSVSPILALMAQSVLLGYAMTVMQSCMRGESEAPNWPEMDDPLAILKPMLIAILAIVVAGTPAWLLQDRVDGVTLLGLRLAAWLYLPGAWMAACLSLSFVAVSPLHVFRVVLALGARYWVVTGLAIALFALNALVGGAIGAALPGFLGTLFESACSFYLLIAGMRILGLACAGRRAALGWD